ncbi:hypothetical protein GCM10010211_48440 [Streptomyces albospinus]|uniref:Transposase n=1 Tax=Streptomyces albospinus TaxID=285515 RepID=A0ABQ2VAS3_9ACTN|nr:hypothetical protein GCM10010211_48440 [Streptomyces albospinus]
MARCRPAQTAHHRPKTTTPTAHPRPNEPCSPADRPHRTEPDQPTDRPQPRRPRTTHLPPQGPAPNSPATKPGTSPHTDPPQNAKHHNSDGAAADAPQPARGKNGRLAPGALRQMVIDHFPARPGEAFTATPISRVIEKSSGVIANALIKVVATGVAEQVTDQAPPTMRNTPAPGSSLLRRGMRLVIPWRNVTSRYAATRRASRCPAPFSSPAANRKGTWMKSGRGGGCRKVREARRRRGRYR